MRQSARGLNSAEPRHGLAKLWEQQGLKTGCLWSLDESRLIIQRVGSALQSVKQRCLASASQSGKDQAACCPALQEPLQGHLGRGEQVLPGC